VTTVQCFLKIVVNRTPCGFPFIKSIDLSSLGPRPSQSKRGRRREKGSHVCAPGMQVQKRVLSDTNLTSEIIFLPMFEILLQHISLI